MVRMLHSLARRTGGRKALAAFTAAVCCNVAHAQAVYRCEAKGKVSYSHEPCVGATVVDTTPTQGLDKSSGVSRKGRDVRREENSKMFNDAVRPLTGRSHEEAKILHRRFKLPASVKLECQWLDARLPAQEAAVKKAGAASREAAETRLFLSRSRYRNLGC